MRHTSTKARVKHATQQIDIRLRPHLLILGHKLRRHIARGPEHGLHLLNTRKSTQPAIAIIDRATPVQKVNLAELAQHDVRRLDIEVQDAARMRVVDRMTHRDQRIHKRVYLLGPALRHDQVRQGPPMNILHGHKRIALFVASNHVHRHDIRVLKVPHSARLAKQR